MSGGLVILSPDSFDEPLEFGWAGGTFEVRYVTPRKMCELRESVGLSRWPPDGERLRAEQAEALRRAVLDWQLVGWSGVTDEQGNDVPCDSEHRWLLVQTDEAFSRLVPQWSQAVFIKRQASARAELGNSKSSSPQEPEPTGTGSSATPDAAGSETDAKSEN